MTLFFSLISGVLTFIVIVGALWTVAGVPTGIILFILRSFNKVKESKKKIFWMCFGGVIALIGAFVLFFILGVIEGFLGFSLSPLLVPINNY